jgi:hypothetical protein
LWANFQYRLEGELMGRSIGAVVLGYLTMFAIVFITLTVSFLALGVDRVFLPGTYAVTPLWLEVMTVFSILSAIAGGRVCAVIGKKKGAVTGLLIVVLILGSLNVIPAVMANGTPATRSGDVPNAQAMMNAREPVWFALVLVVIGVGGVWAGGRSLQRSSF